MKKLGVLITLILLAACATPEQIEAEQQMQEQADFETCRSYGLRPGTEAFGMCRMELDLTRQRRYDSMRYGYGSYYHRHGHPGFGTGLGVGF